MVRQRRGARRSGGSLTARTARGAGRATHCAAVSATMRVKNTTTAADALPSLKYWNACS